MLGHCRHLLLTALLVALHGVCNSCLLPTTQSVSEPSTDLTALLLLCRLRFSFAAGMVQSSARPAMATTLAIVSAVFVIAFNGIITWVVTHVGRAEQ